ncbi:Uncharacterised protein [Mycobacteroides abscessus subsp. abscessus]|nr:Uncharacterised protein [Mycobacteroides abscessus subsp. abscessus]
MYSSNPSSPLHTEFTCHCGSITHFLRSSALTM